MTSEATILGPSNAAIFYKAQFDAVVEALTIVKKNLPFATLALIS